LIVVRIQIVGTCCGDETIILVMRADRSAKAITISEPLEIVSFADLQTALFGGGDFGRIPYLD
jgi:hypothetical protein